MNRKAMFWGIGVLIVLFTVLISNKLLQKPHFNGAVIEPALPAPEIILKTQFGSNFKLSDDKGKIVLLFFGYTNCPDECPLTMAKIKQGLEFIGSDVKDNIVVAMITTDPARDGVVALKKFMSSFNPEFIGLYGDLPSLQHVYNEYGVLVEDGGETHTSFVYVIDKHGNLRITFPSETQASEIASDLRILLQEK